MSGRTEAKIDEDAKEINLAGEFDRHIEQMLSWMLISKVTGIFSL